MVHSLQEALDGLCGDIVHEVANVSLFSETNTHTTTNQECGQWALSLRRPQPSLSQRHPLKSVQLARSPPPPPPHRARAEPPLCSFSETDLPRSLRRHGSLLARLVAITTLALLATIAASLAALRSSLTVAAASATIVTTIIPATVLVAITIEAAAEVAVAAAAAAAIIAAIIAAAALSSLLIGASLASASLLAVAALLVAISALLTAILLLLVAACAVTAAALATLRLLLLLLLLRAGLRSAWREGEKREKRVTAPHKRSRLSASAEHRCLSVCCVRGVRWFSLAAGRCCAGCCCCCTGGVYVVSSSVASAQLVWRVIPWL